ncbi:MAG: hypothetical protein WA979_09495 [Pacificimonas sp.]
MIESATGTRCRQSMNSNGAYLDLGVVGTTGSSLPDDLRGFINDPRDQKGTVYARVTMPLGKKPKRMDCSQIFRLEIERLKREIELMSINAE